MAKHRPPTQTSAQNAAAIEALVADAAYLRARVDRSFDPDADPATLTDHQVLNRLDAVCETNARLRNLLLLRVAEANTVALRAELAAEEDED